jgi:asparagine synthase (glutamine-hydrolysing)
LTLCGILAIYFKSSNNSTLQPLLESLTDSMRHRGPDGRGSYQDAKVFLGHRRLSIIDLTDGGAQPMFSSDGKRVIVFNGEIYNYVELKEELQQQGIVFKASSDTEVLLELISKRGPKSIKQLNGMFAFALWNWN